MKVFEYINVAVFGEGKFINQNGILILMVDFTLGKCKTRAAYSAKLRKQGTLDLKKIVRKCTVVLETPILLVVSVYGVEVIVHQYGELVFKKCEDMGLMERIASEIYTEGMRM